jgi:ABC-type nitrate/sulfonate/bicarbonate transport system substrate-binding protein
MRRNRTLVALTCVLALAAGACGDDGEESAAEPDSADTSTTAAQAEGGGACAPAEGDTISVRASSILGYAPVFLGIETGAFEEAGIEIEISDISAADALAPLAQGRLDVMMTSFSAGLLNAVSSGVEIRWAAPAYEAHPDSKVGYWAPKPESGEFDVASLAGQTVASPTAGSGMGGVIFERIGEEAGVGVDDVNWTRLSGADALIALENGSVPALWLSSPFWVDAAASGDFVFLGGYEPGLNGSAYVVGPSFLEDPERGARFFRVIHEVIEQYLQGDYLEDPETVALLSKALDIPEEQLTSQPPELFDPELSLEGADPLLADLQQVMQLKSELEYSEPLTAEQIVDSSLVESALSCG